MLKILLFTIEHMGVKYTFVTLVKHDQHYANYLFQSSVFNIFRKHISTSLPVLRITITKYVYNVQDCQNNFM